ncbi:helix-turn-helix transcriptional regulator [Steroidobacter sp. S1-65]|uniref:Helix-turn-helix transcriptional regulator n=1 Tax=Steroidobacter gossypii TaxID=2805490 RepID=A0ABS1X353_9GAMM|nr:helix-turn-helix transcriptional regulator [Steroidobacter gossypii]
MHEFPIQTAQQLSIHLRSLRRRLALTQAELGTRLGVAQARVGKIERNPGSISVEQLLQLLTALESELLVRAKATKARATATRKPVW